LTVGDSLADAEDIRPCEIRRAHSNFLGNWVDIGNFIDVGCGSSTKQRENPLWYRLVARDKTFGSQLEMSQLGINESPDSLMPCRSNSRFQCLDQPIGKVCLLPQRGWTCRSTDSICASLLSTPRPTSSRRCILRRKPSLWQVWLTLTLFKTVSVVGKYQ
jgi:hypothetical protein